MPSHQADAVITPAERLSHRWNIFRSETNTLYDTLLWQPLDWPFLTLQWQPAAWQPPQHILDLQYEAAEAAERAALGLDSDSDTEPSNSTAAAAADGMDIDQTAAAAAAAGSRKMSGTNDADVLAMPFEYQYLMTGEQTTGQEPSRLIVWRVSLLGQVPEGFDASRHRLALTRGHIEPVMVIPAGQQDVNRLHIMPQNTDLLAACSDDPLVHLYDLKLNILSYQQQQQLQQRQSESGSPPASSSDPKLPDQLNADRHAAAAAGDDDVSSSEPPPELTAVLGGRSAGGFGLEWNPVHEGLLLGGDVAGCVQLWDVGRGSSSSSSGVAAAAAAVIEPVQVVNGFTGCAINDVSWHSSGNTFAAATESGQLLLQDIRAGAAAAILGQGFGNNLRSGQLHVRRSRAKQDTSDQARDCLCVDFDPSHSYRLASGGRDGYVYVTDMRRLDNPLERLPLHAGDVRHVSWSSGAPGILATAGEDSHVLLWDANKMKNAVKQQQKRQRTQQQQAGSSAAAAAVPAKRPGNELSEAIQQLTVPGLLFLHHGHLASVEQVAWNPDRPWMLASVSGSAWATDGSGGDVEVQESVLMVWEVNRSAGLLDTM